MRNQVEGPGVFRRAFCRCRRSREVALTPKLVALFFALVCFSVACDGSPTGPAGSAIFVVQVVDETFRVRIDDPSRVAQARRILRGDEPQKIVAGELAAGHGGFNQPWSWHLVPATVGFAEATIELCDGKPSFVEEELDYWLNTVGTYCPWLSRVVAEVR